MQTLPRPERTSTRNSIQAKAMGASDDTAKPDPNAKARSDRPRDAATLVIIDTSTGVPRVLMGRRRTDQVFLPNKFVFPGGGVDSADRGVSCASELRTSEATKLLLAMRPEPSAAKARALALAAIRETFEEAGLLVGERRRPKTMTDAAP